MSNTTVTPNRSINQIMGADDPAAVIKNNKNIIMAILAGIIVSLAAFGIYSTFSEKSKAEYNSKIYQFENSALKEYTTKLDALALLEAFKGLQKDIGNYSGLIPAVIKTSDALIAQNHLKEALEVLLVGKNSAKNEYAQYFVMGRLAVVYEDLGQDQNAIETLEKMNSQSVKIFEGKNYLDLGRLYLKKGDKEKAKTSFNYVVEKAKEDAEFVKIAKLYLSKL